MNFLMKIALIICLGIIALLYFGKMDVGQLRELIDTGKTRIEKFVESSEMRDLGDRMKKDFKEYGDDLIEIMKDEDRKDEAVEMIKAETGFNKEDSKKILDTFLNDKKRVDSISTFGGSKYGNQ